MLAASLRRNGVLQTPMANSVGGGGSQLCGAGHRPLPGVGYLKVEISSFASLLNGHIPGELWQ